MHAKRALLMLALMMAILVPWARPVAADSPTTVTYSYDAAGRLVEVAYGDGATIAYSYDAAGNLLTRTIERDFNIYLPLVLRGQTG